MFRRQQPQFQAVRQAVEEPEHKFSWKLLLTSLKILAVVAILAVITWSAYSFREHSNFLVEKVKVVATYEHLDPKALQNIIESYANTNFFDVDASNLRKELLNLPWVHSVSIKRKWPNTLWVDIDEQKAVAQWKDEALLNTDGMLFTPPKETFPPRLPFLNGPEDEVQEIVVNYQKMEAMVEKLELKISRIEVDEQHVWHVTLDSKINLLLNGDNILDGIQSFVSAYPKIIADNPNGVMEMVDLRYKNGMAVKWTQAENNKLNKI